MQCCKCGDWRRRTARRKLRLLLCNPCASVLVFLPSVETLISGVLQVRRLVAAHSEAQLRLLLREAGLDWHASEPDARQDAIDRLAAHLWTYELRV